MNTTPRSLTLAVICLLSIRGACAAAEGVQPRTGLTLAWADNYLTIHGDFPGGQLRTHYLEAYCRAGSTDQDWGKTVIGHQTDLIEASTDGRRLRLRDQLRDGVVVEHTITADTDTVTFQLVAHNPTNRRSEAHWAQPCIRVPQFTAAAKTDPRAAVPAYARKCFVVLEGRLTRLPTKPWALQARYTPGQVYCPVDVDRNDVNPRPLSTLIPSSGLTGCFSGDDSLIMAVAWEPYQELFLGVVTCIHADFRIGGLDPGETKQIRGKIYLVPADVPALLGRYEHDFPEHTTAK